MLMELLCGSFSVTRGQWREGFPSAVCAKSRNVDLNRRTRGPGTNSPFVWPDEAAFSVEGKPGDT